MSYLALRIVTTCCLGLSILRSWYNLLEGDADSIGVSRILAIITVWIL